ncbi:unnamed protein product [Durusdinium trenchii]|uniref:Uncharacterized protein n=1 Tax=Durusdinium trenchii TaxID=1381693 RepID=A0ABP0P0T8_9DINO
MPPHIPTFCQSLDDASSVAAAYQVGRTEAAAATALLKSVSSSTRTKLKDLVRLEAALLQTTWSQTELNIQNDMNALRGWADKFKLFASQQGGLDLQYLSTRFQKGKDAVQQRGVDATGDILAKLLEGLELQDSRPVLVVDCLPNRFGEWSISCANKQLSVLVDGREGDASTTVDHIPWMITSDLDVVALVTTSDGSANKKLMTVADVLRFVTRTRGITEVTMVDHDLEPMTKDEL